MLTKARKEGKEELLKKHNTPPNQTSRPPRRNEPGICTEYVGRRERITTVLYTLNDRRPLGIQTLGVPFVRLLLAVLETRAVV